MYLFITLSAVPAIFQFFSCKPPSSTLVLLPILCLSKAACRKWVPQGILVRDLLMCAFCGDLFFKIDQILDQFSRHDDKCFLDFGWAVTWPSKGCFLPSLVALLVQPPEPYFLFSSQMPKCTFCIVCFTEKDEKEESNGHTQWMRKLKFTNIKRNIFFNLDRMQLTPSLINGLSEIRLEIFAKDNNWNQISRVPICYLVQALF